jgi:hypothetical protein
MNDRKSERIPARTSGPTERQGLPRAITVALVLGLTAILGCSAFVGFAPTAATSAGASTASPIRAASLVPGAPVSLGFLSETGTALGGTLDPLAAVPLSQSATIVVTLPVQNSSGLQTFLRSVSDPFSSDYAQFLSPAEFAASYGAPASDQQAVANDLTSGGATVLYESPDHLSITASATLQQLESIFGVTFAIYTKGADSFYAPTASPTLPSNLAPWVYGVAGLTDLPTDYAPDIVESSAHAGASAPAGFGVMDYPNQMLYEYQLNSLFNATGNRTAGVVPTYARGVTISPLLWSSGVPNDCGYSLADVIAFYNGSSGSISFPSDLPQPIDHANWNVAGDPGSPPGGAGCDTFGTSPNTATEELSLELTIDQEYSGEDAPGAFIEPTYVNGTGPSATDADLEILLDWVAAGNVPNLSVATQSFGGGETNDSAGSYEAVSEQDYEEMAAQGVTVLASSGDDDGASGFEGNGEAVCGSGPTGYGEPTVNYPASSPNVLSVGGTANMALGGPSAPSAGLPGQTVWNWCPSNHLVGGSTGGVSSAFPEPWYQSSDSVVDSAMQNAINVTETGNGSANSPDGVNDGVVYNSTSARAVPDIGGPAANMTGYFGQQWISGWGGTSFSSPSVAGVIGSIIAFDGHRLGLFAPALYALEQEWLDHQVPLDPTYHVLNYTNAFFGGGSYNTSAGWGVPQAYNIARLLGKPFLSTNPDGPAMVGASYPVSATVTDYRNVDRVEVAYDSPGNGGWANASLGLSSGSPQNGVWTGAIPAPSAAGTLEYCVYAIDAGAGNSWTPYNQSAWAATGGADPSFGCTHPWSVPVRASYATTFSETGLAAGTPWGVTIDGAAHTTSASSVSLLLTNGSYPYTVSAVPGYYAPQPADGTLSVAGASQSVSVTYGRPSYTLTFTETGLPKGTTWQVTVNGVTVSGDGSALGISEPNGTYAYSIGGISGWQLTSGTYRGSVTISGSASSVPTSWSVVKYTVTFKESGLSSGAKWTVKMDGVTASTTGTSLEITAANGTYAYTATASGETTLTGSVPVSGAPLSVALEFRASGGDPRAPAGPGTHAPELSVGAARTEGPSARPTGT